MSKRSCFARCNVAVRTALGIMLLLNCALIAGGAKAQTSFSSDNAAAASSLHGLQDALPHPYPAPELADIQGWVNTPPLKIADLKGKVVLVDFWAYSCVNCVRTFSHITAWDAKYRNKGLVILGVHTPEFQFEKILDNVQAAVTQYGIRYPIALDSHYATWNNYRNLYWPAHYLIDKNGQVVYTHFGEGDYDVTENNIRYLLGLKTAVDTAHTMPAFNNNQTPETYLGYERGERYAGIAEPEHDAPATYQFPKEIASDEWALQGAWKVAGENIVSADANAGLRLHFNAKKVFLVLGTTDDKPALLTLRLNGKPIGKFAGKDVSNAGILTVDRHALYELVNLPAFSSGVLEIESNRAGVEAYAFTFGS